MTRIMGTRNSIRPFIPVHPGVILKAELKERGIRQNVFATQIGMRPPHLNALLQGGRNISPQLALRLEQVLGIPAQNWLTLQENYNLDRIRTAELVDGYNPKPVVAVPAFAEASLADNPCQLYRAGYVKGQEDLLEEILNHLIMEGYSKEEALILIGRNK